MPVVNVHLEPLGLYSKKAKSADDLKTGATVAVPNDTANEGRALKLLADQRRHHAQGRRRHRRHAADITDNPRT